MGPNGTKRYKHFHTSMYGTDGFEMGPMEPKEKENHAECMNWCSLGLADLFWAKYAYNQFSEAF